MKNLNTKSLQSKLIEKTAKIRKGNLEATKTAATAGSGLLNDLLPKLLKVNRDIEKLKPAKRRVRTTTPDQLNAVIKSIRHFGFVGAILVKNDTVVDGHVCVEAMKTLGEKTIPAIDVSHLSAEQCRLLAISKNRTGETGTWDLSELRIEIIELDALELPLDVTGFTMPELDIIMLPPASEDSELLDETPEPSAGEPVTRLGDIWVLGKHKLLCGDSLKTESYAVLLGNEIVGGVFTDPPYNCAIAGNVSGLGKVKHGEFAMASGEMTNSEFSDFLQEFLALCAERCVPGAAIFACMDWRQIGRLQFAAEAAGLRHINIIAWDKGSGAMGTPYRSAHEFIAVFCNGPKLAVDNIKLGKHGRDRTNVWHYPGANRPGSSAAKMLADHPTPKPVRLVADALLDLTNKGDLILDPFMGSGTTIIACAESGRVARGIELDPKYVDVAIRRWIGITGEPAVLAETGETFEAVAARRAL